MTSTKRRYVNSTIKPVCGQCRARKPESQWLIENEGDQDQRITLVRVQCPACGAKVPLLPVGAAPHWLRRGNRLTDHHLEQGNDTYEIVDVHSRRGDLASSLVKLRNPARVGTGLPEELVFTANQLYRLAYVIEPAKIRPPEA